MFLPRHAVVHQTNLVVHAGYVPMEHPKVTVGVTGPMTGLFPYITVVFYGGTACTATGGNCRMHASMSSSPALPGAGEDERSIAASFDALAFKLSAFAIHVVL